MAETPRMYFAPLLGLRPSKSLNADGKPIVRHRPNLIDHEQVERELDEALAEVEDTLRKSQR